MTPLVREMIKLVPSPETAMWFDAGTLERTEALSIPIDLVMHLPFPRTAIALTDSKGVKVVLWLIAGENSVAVAGSTQHDWSGHGRRGAFGKDLDPFVYLNTGDGLRYYRGGQEITKAEVNATFRVVAACLLKIQSASEAYKPIPAGKFINAKRAAKGKLPLFDWHTVTIAVKAGKDQHQGGTHASPRQHDRRGHWRRHPAGGKPIWVKACKVGDASNGVVFKDYRVPAVDFSTDQQREAACH